MMPSRFRLPHRLARAVPAVLTAATLACLLPAGAGAAKPAKTDKSAKSDKKAEAKPEPGTLTSEILAGLSFRSIGPALAGGRIADLEVDPNAPATWYVGFASGGIHKTTNAGTTWTPVFDSAGSYSIGDLALDPNNPHVVWAGTGEHNSQRSVSYGDGVYRSEDGGKSWTNMGLKDSGNIGRVVVDPRDSDVVYVAAFGPLWSPGGDRGLYKTTDGGKTWNAILTIDENTGVNDVLLDPRDPDRLYASTYQRRRHEWGGIHGGPQGSFQRSTDGGKTWQKATTGLPKGDIGRIGIAYAPSNPDLLYAVIEAAEGTGTYRSLDRGVTWEKRSGYASSGQYYARLFVDPKDADRIYVMDVFLQVSDDGGKTFRNLGESFKHVDNHTMWINPNDTDHYLVGGDGGLYQSFDRAQNWQFFSNMGAVQFYKIAVDEALPYYNVYGGTQDNSTFAGPSATISRHGILNSDWWVVTGGDGFDPAIDPTDPNIVYAQAQYGALVRFDRRTGEEIFIQPQPGPGEILKWNWDSPLLLSPHNPKRLYFGANRLFRSDDRGQSWTAISGDLTRGIDRNNLPMMGKVWSVDAVNRNGNTSFYGNTTAFDESPRRAGVLYVGTDDGLVHVSEDDGATWRKIERFPGVPEYAYVAALTASRHADGTVFAVFNNHKMGDYKPYLLKSTDYGRTWTAINGDLPERGSTWDLVEDHVQPNLLFAGTEFGAYASVDGGGKWLRLSSGLPTIAVRDLEIQRRENDLVVGTFGRGIYILDDYEPLRQLSRETLLAEATLFPVEDAAVYVPSGLLGYRGKAFQGDAFWTADNPPFGAVFTYHLKEELLSKKKQRQKAEKELEEKGETLVFPSWDALRAEDQEEAPTILLTIADEAGQVLRRLEGNNAAGISRVAWDLRTAPADPVRLNRPQPNRDNPWIYVPQGPMVAPGRYTVTLSKRVDGVETVLSGPQSFAAVAIGTASLPNPDREALFAFTQRTARLQRAVQGAAAAAGEMDSRLDHLAQGLENTAGSSLALRDEVRALRRRLTALQTTLEGDTTVASRNEPTSPSITERVSYAITVHWSATSPVTASAQTAYDLAAQQFAPWLADFRQLAADLVAFEARAEQAGVPWTPGRIPTWSAE
jgi:photosystem II stability/assembly factor-like uncharacterized protein